MLLCGRILLPGHERDVPCDMQPLSGCGQVGKQAGLLGNRLLDSGQFRTGTVLWFLLLAPAPDTVSLYGKWPALLFLQPDLADSMLIDLPTGSGMPDRVLVRALSYAALAPVQSYDVRRAGSIRRRSRLPWTEDARLPEPRRADGSQMGAITRSPLHIRSVPLCCKLSICERNLLKRLLTHYSFGGRSEASLVHSISWGAPINYSIFSSYSRLVSIFMVWRRHLTFITVSWERSAEVGPH